MTNMAGIAPGSMRIEDQAGSGSQILAFHKASTWWSRTIGLEAQVLCDVDSGFPIALPLTFQYGCRRCP